MSIGFDCGTYNLVSCKRNDKGDFVYRREVNAFLEMPLDNPFVFNMMKKAGVPLIQREDTNTAYALGEAAMNIAYTMPMVEVKRPMCDGCVNPREKDAFQIMSVMMHGLLGEVTKDKTIVYYTVPANAINLDTDADYHSKVLESIFKSYKSKDGHTVEARPINEALCLVYAELQNKAYTGIGISCLCPGTLVYSEKGIVPIETVCVGDLVLTHKGRWRPVTKVTTKNFNGLCTNLNLNGYSGPKTGYKFVDNHEVYVKRNGSWKWIGCEEVKVGDIVGEPIANHSRETSRPGINICERITSSKKYLKKRIEVTSDVQRLIGYFLGDGSINHAEGCVQFDFAIHERENIEDVKTILKKNFNKESSEIDKGENCVRVKCYSKGLVSWFSKNCYINKEKNYPWSIDRICHTDCINLLAGLIRSDGHISDNKINFFNSNTRLIMLVKQLFSRLGVATSVARRDSRENNLGPRGRVIRGGPSWSVSTGSKTSLNSLRHIIENISCDNSVFSEKLFVEDNFCCSRVRSVSTENYEGVVYDLTVEEDHSFSGPNLTIHNCGAGMVNVAFSLFAAPVFQFAIVNSGDWIDKQAARATGETVAFINKEKMKIDLSKQPTNLVERAIMTQYNIMIEKTVTGIKKGIEENKKAAKMENPVDIVLAGGTASPNGFEGIFKSVIESANLPIPIGNIIKPTDPLYSVSRGALVAAENAV